MATNSSEFDWARLFPHFVHPIKVAIIEAMVYLHQPLSASDLRDLFLGEYSLPTISYHVTSLKNADLIVKVREVQKRGAFEKFYMLNSNGHHPERRPA
jgi:DNA-binding transcriptional ArsR family regulator